MNLEVKHLTLERLLRLSASGNVDQIVEYFSTATHPTLLRIGAFTYPVPTDAATLRAGLTYGQKQFLAEKPKSDLDLIFRMFDGYYYPIVTKRRFSESAALKFGSRALRCNIDEVIPICCHIARLVSEINQFEEEHLASQPDPEWERAEAGRLGKYGAMLSVRYLSEVLKCKMDEVFDKPYDECLGWLLYQKESNDVERDYNKQMQEKMKHGART